MYYNQDMYDNKKKDLPPVSQQDKNSLKYNADNYIKKINRNSIVSTVIIIICGLMIVYVNVISSISDSKQDDAIKKFDEFMRAVKKGDLNTVESMLKSDKDLLYQTTKTVEYRRVGRRSHRIEKETHETPLGTAVKQGNLMMAKLLLEKGAKVNKSEKNGMTPLHFACKISDDKSKEMILLLLNYKANPNFQNIHGETPLFFIIKKGNLELTQLLIEHGASMTITDKKGWTPLHTACRCGQLDMVKLLIQKGADTESLTPKKEKPIDIAELFNNKSVVEYLKTKPMDS